MQRQWHIPLLLSSTLLLAACGSSKSSNASGTLPAATTGNNAAAEQTISDSSYSSKMARQTHDDTQQQSDMSETATTGSSDGGGTHSLIATSVEAGFNFQSTPGVDFSNINADFHGSLSFNQAVEAGMTLQGNCDAQVHHGGDQNLSMALTLNMNRTLSNGDIIHIVSEPNVVVTKVGNRQAGTVTRTINGTVERTLVSADPNRSFDLSITHQGTTVVDTYASGSLLLNGRTINGTATVVDHLNNMTATVVHNNIKRGPPQACLCPISGTITQTITGGGATETHTYTFGGTCGQSTVSVDGSAAVTAGATATVGNSNSAVAASGSATTEVHASGNLAWDQCVPKT